MAKITLRAVQDYDYPMVKNAIFSMLDQLEAKELIQKDQQVLIKANLLSKKKPEDGVTTHPMVIRAVCEYVIDQGAKAVIGDSPAGPFKVDSLQGIYAATGMLTAATQSGAELNYNVGYQTVTLKDYKTLERIELIDAVLEADVIIDVAKLKTHVMMTYTGAVKNLFGTVPGLTKASYHMKLQEPQHFANHLIDICQRVKPALSIIDGIVAMEGDGPSNGTKRKLGYLLGGQNPYELDYVACKLVGIEEEKVATIVESVKRGLLSKDQITGDFGDKEMNRLELEEKIRQLMIHPFQKPQVQSVNFLHGKIPRFLENFLIKHSKSKPVFVQSKCIGCGKCAQSCPAKIITIQNQKATTDLQGCISCFCCHEVCPVDAVEIKIPILAKVFFGEKVKTK